ncbi:MAG: hypothetical protein ACAI44_33735 [Candidatus Sericytochromatia bacterium]
MPERFSRHPFISWLLLASMLVHFLIAHHDGGSALMLCHHTDGQIRIESVLDHASPAEEHYNAGHLDEYQDEHHDSGHQDEHLALSHPELYSSQSVNAFQDALAQALGKLQVIACLLRPAERLALLPAEAALRLPEQPPRTQRIRSLILNTTILLI